jgi:hypothetical protein
MASGLVSRRAVEAEVLLVVLANAALATTPVPVPTVPLAVLPAVLSVPAVVVLDRAGADDEEGDGLGHAFLYTNCSGGPLQVVAAPAS